MRLCEVMRRLGPGPAGSARVRRRSKLGLILVANLGWMALFAVGGELAFRLFWGPKYWIWTDRWLIGSGQTVAGKKWWPETTYHIESREFRTTFRTNAQGYRARPFRSRTGRPYRIAWVGDSFTEGMQVDAEQTFCALVERAFRASGRELACENFGVAGTGLFEYWHRICHDVLAGQPPDALVLCLYPGNDFLGEFPDAAFDPSGGPLRDYYDQPSAFWHAVTWLNLNSKFACYLQQRIFLACMRWGSGPYRAPEEWWTDPARAASAPDAPIIARSRALLKAIAEACRSRGTRLCILVVGPARHYTSRNGTSPLAQILADWQVDVPVLDVSIATDSARHAFPRDGHLNPEGHRFVAREASGWLRGQLFDRSGPVAAR